MSTFQDRFDAYIDAHPRESLFMAVIAVSVVWNTAVGLLALLIYVLAVWVAKIDWWYLLGFGIVCLLCGLLAHGLYWDVSIIIGNGWYINKNFWLYLYYDMPHHGFRYLFAHGWVYMVCVSPLLAGVFSVIGCIPGHPFNQAKKSLQKGELLTRKKEISEKKITKRLNTLNDDAYDMTVLGVSKYTGQYVGIPDRVVNQILLVLGTTGSGKTITLRRFYRRAIVKGYPLIIVDGKPSAENVTWLQQLADDHGRTFYGFNCANYSHYNCFANGGHTELKDKIISLKDQWESDYYRSIAEDYLQTEFSVLLKSGDQFGLQDVVKCLNYDNLMSLARQTKDKQLIDDVVVLGGYDRKDISGLQAHLNILLKSELGEYFKLADNAFTLRQVVDENAIVYFALPALKFPSFSKVLGKLVINDIKTVIDGNDENKPIFTIFDEFSVFAGDQVLNLVNMGRGKGMHAVFGTQGLADLERVDPSFKSQIMNCVNSIICHRLNDQKSAEDVTNWIGTQEMMSVTAQLDTSQSNAQLGTLKYCKEFMVHPDEIKQNLGTGEAFLITKVGAFKQDKVVVKYL